MANSFIMRSFPNIGDKSTTKRNREEWAASPQLANKAKRAPEVAWLPAQWPPQQQKGQEYHKCQIELYDQMRAMGANAICQELYKGFLDLFTTTHSL